MAGSRCNECGLQAPEGAERCPRCGAPVPVLFDGGGQVGYVDDDATAVTAGVPRGGPESGDLVADRYELVGEPRPDLWGAWLRARDVRDDRDLSLYRVERSVFRTRDDIERFRTAQQDLLDVDEPALLVPERVLEAGGLWYLVYSQRIAGTLRDPQASGPFRGADSGHVRRLLRFAADYFGALGRLGTRAVHLGLRAGTVVVVGRDLRVAQTGFCSVLPADLVARRLTHDAEARFYAAPEVRQQGRGSARADVYSLGLVLGFAVSGRERTPQLKGFVAHRAFAQLFNAMVSPEEIARPGDPQMLAADFAQLADVEGTLVAAPRGGEPRPEGTVEVASDDVESLDDVEELDFEPVGEGTAEIAVGELEPVDVTDADREAIAEIALEELESVEATDAHREGTAEIAVDEIESVEVTGTERESLPAFDDTDPSMVPGELPPFGEDSWSPTPRTASQVPSAAAGRPAPRPAAPITPEESDGAIDPRLLRAAVRSDAAKGIAAKGKAVDLLRRDAAQGHSRSRELLMDASTRLPKRPSAASAPAPAPVPAAAPAPARPSKPLGFAPVSAPIPLPVAPTMTLQAPTVPPDYVPSSPMMPSVPAAPPRASGFPAPAPAPRPSFPASAPAPAPAPAPVLASPRPAPVVSAPPPRPAPVVSAPPPRPAPVVSAPPPRPAPVVSAPPPRPAPVVSAPPPLPAPAAPVPAARPAPAVSAPPSAPVPAARSVRPAASTPPLATGPVGADLVVKGRPGAAGASAADLEDSGVLTVEAQVGRPAAQPDAPPVTVRKVRRAPSDDIDLPPTEAWSPHMEAPPTGRPAGRKGGPPAAPLFDDSYKLFRSDDLAARQPPQQQVPDRSMDLIWWSLAIAGALVLVALLITFR